MEAIIEAAKPPRPRSRMLSPVVSPKSPSSNNNNNNETPAPKAIAHVPIDDQKFHFSPRTDSTPFSLDELEGKEEVTNLNKRELQTFSILHDITPVELQLGDHIYILTKLLFRKHGIIVKTGTNPKDIQVIHLSSPPDTELPDMRSAEEIDPEQETTKTSRFIEKFAPSKSKIYKVFLFFLAAPFLIRTHWPNFSEAGNSKSRNTMLETLKETSKKKVPFFSLFSYRRSRNRVSSFSVAG